MKIGNVQLKNEYIFAPIAGYSDVGFRSLCSKYGAGLTVTEMVSAKGLNFNNPNSEVLLATTKGESPVAVQLFGSDPEQLFKAAQNPLLKKFDIIDINMGCPVRKVTSNGEGSALMKNPKFIAELVQATVEGGKRPVTVKLRSGFDLNKPTVVECAIWAQKGGASAVTIHPRFREQFYSGYADWSLIGEVKNAVDIPVIANGDIVDFASAKAVKQVTNCDGIMIARGALGKPYIFAELLGKTYINDVGKLMLKCECREDETEYCGCEDEFGKDKVIDIKADILEQIEVMTNFMSERVVANNMKMHLCYFAKNIATPKAVRQSITTVKTLSDLLKVIDEFF